MGLVLWDLWKVYGTHLNFWLHKVQIAKEWVEYSVVVRVFKMYDYAILDCVT